MRNPIRIVLAASDSYVMPLAAAVRSVIDTAKSADEIELLVVSCGIPLSFQSMLLESWSPIRHAVTFAEIDRSKLDDLPKPPRSGLSSAAYARLFLPELMPDSWTRAIYMDSDTVTLQPLDDLWNVDLEDMPLAAIQDFTIPFIASRGGVQRWHELDLNPHAKYFNSGVMVMDIDAMRDIFDRALDYIKSSAGALNYFDQDGLNAAVNGRFKALDQSWNATHHWLSLSMQAGERRLPPHAKIRHFIGRRKPWNKNSSGEPICGTEEFFTSLDRTVWQGWRP